MPVCPNCQVEFRQRKDGACPSCGEPLELHSGRYYRASLGSPTVALVEHFERLVSERTSQMQKRILVWRIPRKSPQYRRELVEAERLLDMVDGDYDLVVETLNLMFANPQFRRNFTTLRGIQSIFSVALVVAQANRTKAEAADAIQDFYYKRMMEQEDLFG